LKCVYCSFEHSSQWATELIAAGELDRAKYEKDYAGGENQDFQDLFWKWYHDVGRHSIRTIFTIGGEPLLGDSLHRFMDRLWDEHADLNSPAPDKPWINIVSNLSLPPEYLDRLLERFPKWLENFHIDFNVSLESVGERAEYIRSGMKWEHFDRNIDRLFGSRFNGTLRLSFLPTLCSTSISSTPEFAEYYVQKSIRFDRPITLKRNVAMFPPWQCPLILTPDFCHYLTDAAAKLNEFGDRYPLLHGWKDFRDYLLKMAEGIREQRDTADTRSGRDSFARQVATLDQRRNVNFRKIFPEYREFLSKCEGLVSGQSPFPGFTS
jgi:hypothetical protein